MRRELRAGGFALPATVVFVTVLMSLASAAIGSVTALSRVASASQSRLISKVTLEAGARAAAAAWGGLQTGATHSTLPSSFTYNGLSVQVAYQYPTGKLDINSDPVELIATKLLEKQLPAGLVERVVETIASPEVTSRVGAARFDSFEAFAAQARLSPGEEDCARAQLTLAGGPTPEWRTALSGSGPGSQIELRLSTNQSGVGEHLLWARLRAADDPERPWRVHEWRFLEVREPLLARGCLRDGA